MSISPMVSFWASSPLSFDFSATQCIVLSLFVFCGKKIKCKNVNVKATMYTTGNRTLHSTAEHPLSECHWSQKVFTLAKWVSCTWLSIRLRYVSANGDSTVLLTPNFFSVSGHFETPSPSLDHIRGIDPVSSSRRHERTPRSDGSSHELKHLTNPLSLEAGAQSPDR